MLKIIVPLERSTTEQLRVNNCKVNRFDVYNDNTLKSQKKRQSLKIWLSQEKSYQQMEIQLILILRRSD